MHYNNQLGVVSGNQPSTHHIQAKREERTQKLANIHGKWLWNGGARGYRACCDRVEGVGVGMYNMSNNALVLCAATSSRHIIISIIMVKQSAIILTVPTLMHRLI